MKTLKELAKEAIDIQDACNLSGIVHSFSRVMNDLSELGISANERNTHPISILWASKIASLTHCEMIDEFGKAYCWAKEQ